MEKITVRPQVRSDIEQFYLWELTPAVTEFFSLGDGQTREEVAATFDEIEADPAKAGYTILGEDGRLLGRIYLAGIDRHLDAVELYRLYIGDPAERNKGFGRQALMWLMEKVFREDTFHRLYLDYYPGNPAQYLYESVGFRHEGLARGACKKMGKYRDVYKMAILRDDYEALYCGGKEGAERTPEAAPDPADTIAVAEGAVISGDVTFGRDCSVWYNAVLRGDNGTITVGDRTNFQENAVVHTTPGGKAVIGSDVTVGHGAIIHGATIGDGSLIGMGSIVMDDAVIGKDSIVAAGALVPPGKTYPDGVLIMGSPAKAVRAMTEADLAGNRSATEEYLALKGTLTTVPR